MTNHVRRRPDPLTSFLVIGLFVAVVVVPVLRVTGVIPRLVTRTDSNAAKQHLRFVPYTLILPKGGQMQFWVPQKK